VVSNRTYLSIGDVLTLLREEFPDVTISKIRFLESQGLVNPERSPSGYRKFYDHDVERLRWVLRQQREHFLPLKVIRDRLANDAGEGAPVHVAGTDTVAALDTHANGTPEAVGPAERSAVAAVARAGAPAAPAARAGGIGVVTGGRSPDPAPEVPSERPGASEGAPELAHAVAPAPRHTPTPPEMAQSPATAGRPPIPRTGVVGPGSPGTGRLPRAGPAPGAPTPAVVPPAPTVSPRAPAPRAEYPAPGGTVSPSSAGQGPSEGAALAPGRMRPVAAGPQEPAGPPPARPAPTRPDGPPQAPAGPTPNPPAPAPGPGTPRSGRSGAPPAGPGFAPAPGISGASLTAEELSKASGLSETEVATLEGYALVEPMVVAGVLYYDEEALTVAKLVAEFGRYGIEPRHLRLYRHAVDREVGLIEQIITPLLRQRNPESRQRAVDSATDLATLGQNLRASLLRRELHQQFGG